MTGASDGLLAIARVIAENHGLQRWFRDLVALPQNLRVSAIGRMVAEMRANREDEELVAAFASLADAETCRVLAGVLRDGYKVRL